MKPVSPELLALLQSRAPQLFVADLYTFAGGNLGANVLRYCSGDQDISANGQTYSCGGQTGPYFGRDDNKAKMHWRVGTSVDQIVFDVAPKDATLFGVPFLQAVRSGLFDGVELTLERAFMPTYGDTSRGLVRLFAGRVAAIDLGRSLATFTVSSHLELLTYPLPRNLFQPGCVNNLGDAACGIVQGGAQWPTRAGVAAADSSASTILTSSLPPGEIASGAFDLGKIIFTSGALAGLSRTIKHAGSGTPAILALMGAFPSAPAAGDAFNAFWGCDKSFGANGCPKFANQARFKGFQNVPQPSVAI